MKQESRNRPTTTGTIGFMTRTVPRGGGRRSFSVNGFAWTGHPNHGHGASTHNRASQLNVKKQNNKGDNCETYISDCGIGKGFLTRTQRIITIKEF